MIQDSSNPEYFILNHKLRNDMKNDIITLPSKYKDIVTYPVSFILIEFFFLKDLKLKGWL
jgi:hypothetical protein